MVNVKPEVLIECLIEAVNQMALEMDEKINMLRQYREKIIMERDGVDK